MVTAQLRSQLRFLSAAALIVLTAAVLYTHQRPHDAPARQPLASFPDRVGPWMGKDFTIPTEALEVLGPGDFLSRAYQQTTDDPPLELFIAYFPSQRTGDTIHSPKNCLPGAGWAPVQFRRLQVAAPGGISFPANLYLVAKGSDRALVLYWYQAHDRRLASEYWAKFYLVEDAIRMNRSDGALVRLITPVAPGQTIASAQARLLRFAQQIIPLLDNYIPR